MVWLARDPSGGRVAVKSLKPEHAADERLRALFAKEMRIAAAIRHPNVVSVLATGQDGATPFIVMEWVDGVSLRAIEKASAHGVPLGVGLRIVSDACLGLHAAHETHDLVHRDVSPHNLLVARDGTTKVIDFGVAKARELAAGETTSSGALKGKVRYMAPEQTTARAIDRRADVFALGAVLYELVTGRAPFEGPNDLAILRMLLSPSSVEVPANVPPAIAEILERALAKKASGRFANALEMREAIERAMVVLDVGSTSSDVACFVESLAIPRPGGAPTRSPAVDEPEPTVVELLRPPSFPSVSSAPLVPAPSRRWRAVIVGAAVGIGALGSALLWASSPPTLQASPDLGVRVAPMNVSMNAEPAPPRVETPAVANPSSPAAVSPSPMSPAAQPIQAARKVGRFHKSSPAQAAPVPPPTDLDTALHDRR